MGIRFACHECEKRLNVKRDLAGKRGVCPQCATRFRIPTEDAEKSIPIVATQSSVVASQSDAAMIESASSKSSPKPKPLYDSAASVDLLVDDPTSTWYVRPPTGGQYGPATSEVLRIWIGEGRVAATSLLWRDGWPQWRVASEALPDLIQPLPVMSSPSVARNGATASETISPDASFSLDGQADVGAQRRARSGRRILGIGVLLAVAIILMVALLVIVNRQ